MAAFVRPPSGPQAGGPGTPGHTSPAVCFPSQFQYDWRMVPAVQLPSYVSALQAEVAAANKAIHGDGKGASAEALRSAVLTQATAIAMDDVSASVQSVSRASIQAQAQALPALAHASEQAARAARAAHDALSQQHAVTQLLRAPHSLMQALHDGNGSDAVHGLETLGIACQQILAGDSLVLAAAVPALFIPLRNAGQAMSTLLSERLAACSSVATAKTALSLLKRCAVASHGIAASCTAATSVLAGKAAADTEYAPPLPLPDMFLAARKAAMDDAVAQSLATPPASALLSACDALRTHVAGTVQLYQQLFTKRTRTAATAAATSPAQSASSGGAAAASWPAGAPADMLSAVTSPSAAAHGPRLAAFLKHAHARWIAALEEVLPNVASAHAMHSAWPEVCWVSQRLHALGCGSSRPTQLCQRAAQCQIEAACDAAGRTLADSLHGWTWALTLRPSAEAAAEAAHNDGTFPVPPELLCCTPLADYCNAIAAVIQQWAGLCAAMDTMPGLQAALRGSAVWLLQLLQHLHQHAPSSIAGARSAPTYYLDKLWSVVQSHWLPYLAAWDERLATPAKSSAAEE